MVWLSCQCWKSHEQKENPPFDGWVREVVTEVTVEKLGAAAGWSVCDNTSWCDICENATQVPIRVLNSTINAGGSSSVLPRLTKMNYKLLAHNRAGNFHCQATT